MPSTAHEDESVHQESADPVHSRAAGFEGWWPVLASSLGMFVLAALLLPAAPGMGDSAELTLALALAGVPHPTGYPLYVLLGNLFVRAVHALGASWVVAAALWSAAGAAVAVGGYVRMCQHLLGAVEDQSRLDGHSPARPVVRRLAVGLPVLALAFNPVWLDSATVAEVYSWHHACLALSAAFMLGWLRRLSDAAETLGSAHSDSKSYRDVRSAAIWGLLCGTCGTQHATALFFVATMSVALVAALLKARRWHGGLALISLGASLIPLASYGWIAWRAVHPAAFQWPVGPGFAQWWMHLRGAAYSYLLGRFAPSLTEWALIRTAILPWVLGGMLAGTCLALSTRSIPLRWGLLALLTAAAIQIAFIVSYGIPDPDSYFLPVLMTGLLALTPGILLIGRRISTALLVTVAIGLLIGVGTWSVPRAISERHALVRTDAQFHAAWHGIPFNRGIVLWADDHYHRFVLIQLLEGEKPNIYLDNPEMLIWPARRHAFQKRFGFDPLQDLTLHSVADLQQIPYNIKRRATVPVMIIPETRAP